MQFKELDYNKIIEDKKAFHEFIYTPLSEAIKILEERRKDKDLQKKIEELLDGEIPEIFKGDDLKGFQFRQIATPNHETLMFIKIAKEFNFKPIICELAEDKFTTNNRLKLSMGQLKIYNKNSSIEKINIIDIKKSDGKKIKEIKTIKGLPLVDFHKKLFTYYDNHNISFYDMSDWYLNKRKINNRYYEKVFLFFICNGILFENFLTTKPEKDFVEKIILPAFDDVFKKTKMKPLIVPLLPKETEGSEWFEFYEENIKKIIYNF
jgi:hypothetical protein